MKKSLLFQSTQQKESTEQVLNKLKLQESKKNFGIHNFQQLGYLLFKCHSCNSQQILDIFVV